jgi:GNAT superfamily N-acetyltransferase
MAALQAISRPAKIDLDMAQENTGWVALEEAGLGELQSFLDANPEYWRVVMGTGTPPHAAREIFDDRPPPEWPSVATHQRIVREEGGDIAGVATYVQGIFAPPVWHLGLFIVATRLHGTGRAMALYASLESLMRSAGAQWLRLGVVVGNMRAERFWEKAGFVEVRRRYGVELDHVTRDLRVMMKPLAGGSVEQYLRLVDRDRPDD